HHGRHHLPAADHGHARPQEDPRRGPHRAHQDHGVHALHHRGAVRGAGHWLADLPGQDQRRAPLSPVLPQPRVGGPCRLTPLPRTPASSLLMWLGRPTKTQAAATAASMTFGAAIPAGPPKSNNIGGSTFTPADPTKQGWMAVILLVAGFIGVVAGAVIMTVAQ